MQEKSIDEKILSRSILAVALFMKDMGIITFLSGICLISYVLLFTDEISNKTYTRYLSSKNFDTREILLKIDPKRFAADQNLRLIERDADAEYELIQYRSNPNYKASFSVKNLDRYLINITHSYFGFLGFLMMVGGIFMFYMWRFFRFISTGH